MNILHVLSQFEVTGAEVYAVTLATAQKSQGHSVTLISDTLHVPYNGRYIAQAIGNRSYTQRFRNITFLIRFIREHDIHVLHGHSRAASWVCNIVSRLTHIPFVSTIHGRQHLHFSSRAWSVYGKNIIAVSDSLKDHLIQELRLDPKHITTIPNGFDTRHWTAAASPQPEPDMSGVPADVPILLFIGRFSGPKGDVVRSLVSDVYPALRRNIPCSLQIIGGLKIPEDIMERVLDMQSRFGRTSVVVREFQLHLIPFFRAADVVIGSGRVVMESLMAGKFTFAFGESGYEGLIRPDNYDTIRLTNFGDTGIRKPIDTGLIVRDLTAVLGRELAAADTRLLQKRVQETCDIRVIERKITAVYRSAIAEKKSSKSIPVLMYHRVVPEAPMSSRHGIWVTAQSFEAQLKSLKERGLSTITFEQYQRFLRHAFDLPDNPVILTFDDGYEDNYTYAFPLLKKYGCSAVIFLVTDPSHRTNCWDADEPQVPLLRGEHIREMRNAGIEFGSHTVTHPNLTHSSPAEMRKELMDSKEAVEQLMEGEVSSLAYPYGGVNETVKSITAEAGYKFGIATNSGPMTFYEDFYEIRRTQVFPWTDTFGFWKKTQAWYVRYKKRKSIQANGSPVKSVRID